MSSASRLAPCLATPSSSARRDTVGCSAATARSTKPNDGRIASPPAVATACAETVGHAAVGGGDEDREVRLGHAAHGGTNVAPSGGHGGLRADGQARQGAERARRPGTCSVKAVPAGQDQAVAGPSRCSVSVDRRDGVAVEAEEDLLAVHVVPRAGASGRELDLPQADLGRRRATARRRR